MYDLINNPEHYTNSKFECVKVINDWNLNFQLGNVLKYVKRCNHKGHKIEDLRKAIKYIELEIERETELTA